MVVEVVENNHRPHVVDKEEGDDDHPEDEEYPKCANRCHKINILTEINIDEYPQGDTEDEVDHLEDDVGVDVSVVVCSESVDLATSKC